MRVIFIEDVLQPPEEWDCIETDNHMEAITSKWNRLPDNTRIYHRQVAQICDVTPGDQAGIKRLEALEEGPLYVVTYPGNPITLIIIAVVAVAAAAFFFLRPEVPNPSIRSFNRQNDRSANNELSDRENRPRVNARIPDIFGTVRSVPDLLAVPYKVFEDQREVEYAYMCVGRGEYDVDQDDVKDGATKISDIAGASVEIYGPNTSPNSGDSPQLRIGTAISEAIYSTTRLSAVNGQVLRAPNANSVQGSGNIRFKHPDEVQVDTSSGIDFDDFFEGGDTLVISGAQYTEEVAGSGVDADISARFIDGGDIEFEVANTDDFEVGDAIQITGAFFTYNSGANAIDLDGTYVISGKTSSVLTLQTPENINSDWNLIAGNFASDQTGYATVNFVVPTGTTEIDLDGTYTILSVNGGTGTITLSNPSSVNADWAILDDLTDDLTGYGSPLLSTSSNKWVGPFTIDRSNLTRVLANFVATNGLFKDNGSSQIAFSVTVEIGVTPLDAGGTPTGSEVTTQATVVGSSTTQSQRAVTLAASVVSAPKLSIRARRVTDADLSFNGTVVDEIQWRDLFSQIEVEEDDFGNVTTVQSVTFATSGALSVKDRELNMIVTRKIPTRVGSTSTFSGSTATNRADEILCAIALDPFIGNRDVSELDVDNIYDTIAEAEAYFGSEDAVSFSYTFDTDNLSFEETVAAVAQAVFMKAFRRGSQIKLVFERANEDSTLLFNHRNKLPGSETRTIRFGNEGDNDGIELEWIDPEDDAIVTEYVPVDKSAVNPKKIETIGVRTKLQAVVLAQRAFNKQVFQRVSVDFEATEEAELLVLTDRVVIADNTRPGTQDGDVISQDGLELELSQEITLEGGESYVIFLQHYDGTVESIEVSSIGTTARHLVLASAPSSPLSLDTENFARATFQVVKEDDPRELAFIVTEKTPRRGLVAEVKAVNYDFAYYQFDGLLVRTQSDAAAVTDGSGFARDFEALGSHTVANDADRGWVQSHPISDAAIEMDPVLNSESTYTKMAWVKRLDEDAGGSIIGSRSPDSNEIFWINTADVLEVRHTDSGGTDLLQLDSESQVPHDTWVHCAVTYDETSGLAIVYLDGEPVKSGTLRVADPSTLLIAGFNVTTSLVGYLDDVRYYGRVLSPLEVRRIYQVTNHN